MTKVNLSKSQIERIYELTELGIKAELEELTRSLYNSEQQYNQRRDEINKIKFKFKRLLEKENSQLINRRLKRAKKIHNEELVQQYNEKKVNY